MAGHSKWANIKHKKANADAKRGKIFSKIAKEIMVVARAGGGDPAGNITLRALIQKARSFNIPADNIQKAIKKGTGELEGEALEEIMYEGYGPGGIALMVQVLTDNKNRSVAEVRNIFTKNNTSMAGPGSVSHAFQRKGLILIHVQHIEENKLMELVLEEGAEDLQQENEHYAITTPSAQFMNVVEALNRVHISLESSEITFLPDNYMPIEDASQAKVILKFIGALEDLDDVQNVYSNFDIADSLAEVLSEE
ncbi:MAG: YebC/PmpR family DNA-binding transcriptional regulator [Kiritimatiellae bacterium]|nr:YebC/PmpR family DNA-binding transcriptional regulator [Kiritimatiellia bacterium]